MRPGVWLFPMMHFQLQGFMEKFLQLGHHLGTTAAMLQVRQAKVTIMTDHTQDLLGEIWFEVMKLTLYCANIFNRLHSVT